MNLYAKIGWLEKQARLAVEENYLLRQLIAVYEATEDSLSELCELKGKRIEILEKRLALLREREEGEKDGRNEEEES